VIFVRVSLVWKDTERYSCCGKSYTSDLDAISILNAVTKWIAQFCASTLEYGTTR